MNYKRQSELPYPQPWEWIKDNIDFYGDDLFFVDIGAHDGIDCSNTAFFEMNSGWNGICIEPHPDVYLKLEENRKCIKYNCCISDKEGECDFLVISGYSEMLSGIYSEYDEKHIDRIEKEINLYGGSKKNVKIKSRNLNNILNENNIKKVDYLSVDTEGSEFNIIKSIDFSKTDISIISVENNGYNNFVREYLENNGYQFLIKCCCDEIYCKK